MKKCFALFLILILLLGLSTTAAADGFDLTVFEGAENIGVDEDEMEGDAYIDLESYKPCFFEPGYSENYYCSFYPSIYVSGDDGRAVFRMFCRFFGESWAFIDEIIIKVGDNRYSFTNVEADRKVDDDTSDIIEVVAIVIDSNSVAFMKDLQLHSKDTIKVRLKGDNYNCDFTMSDTMIESILNMYDLYVQAGGTDSDNLDKIVETTPMTVR